MPHNFIKESDVKKYIDRNSMTEEEKEEWSRETKLKIEALRGRSLKVSNMLFPGDRSKARRTIRG